MTRQELSVTLEKSILEISKQQRNNKSTFVDNCILYVFMDDVRMRYKDCADKCKNMFGITVDRDGVRKTTNRLMFPFGSRVPYVKYSKKLVDGLLDYIDGKSTLEEFKTKHDEEKKNKKVIRIALLLLYKKLIKGKKESTTNALMSLDEAFMLECFEEIISAVTQDSNTNISDYEKEILRLESERNRANNLISRLQEEFDERLTESRKEEQGKLIQELNSSRYDGILDQLTTLQNGLKQLRRERIAVPMQINTLQSFVRNMLQFVEDCGITPMMDLGEELEISALEAEYYEYRGEPFTNNSEKKKVVVVATGWENREKNIIISQPTVQEVLSEANNIDMQLKVDDKEAQSAGEYEGADAEAEQHIAVASEEKAETISIEDKKNGSESAILESESNASFEETPIKTDETEICGKVEQNNEIVTVNEPCDSESVEPKDIISETHEQLIDENEQKEITNNLETDDQNATSAPTSETVMPEEPANDNKPDCEKDLAEKKEESKTHTNSYKKHNPSSDNESVLSQPEKTEKATKIANNKSQLQIFGDYCLTKFSEGKKAFQLEDFTGVIKSNNISMVQKRLNELCDLGFMIFSRKNGYEWVGTKENWDEHWKKLNDRHANNNSGRKNK